MNLPELDALLRDTLADAAPHPADAARVAAWVRAARLNGSQAGAARGRAFAVARAAVATRPAAAVLAWLEAVLPALELPDPAAPVGGPAVACFSPGVECLSRVVSRFQSARRSADVCVFTITDDRITRALLDAHHRGVQVRVVTDNEKAGDAGSDVDRIAAAGVPVKVDRTPFHMHHKFAIFDGERLVNGSYNWTRGAADQNEENLVDTGDSALVAAFRRAFDALWAKL